MALGKRSGLASAADGEDAAGVRAAYDTGPGYGHCSIASNGMWCASWPEREMCEWLIEHGVEFEMHKSLSNGRMCDFYFDGIYWEMDGMDRVRRVLRREVRRPALRGRDARGLQVPGGASPGDCARGERRPGRVDRDAWRQR